jgi:hypothetical protein
MELTRKDMTEVLQQRLLHALNPKRGSALYLQLVEPKTAAGQILLTPSQIALLEALASLPNRTAPSRKVWFAAAQPFAEKSHSASSYSALLKISRRIGDVWVSRYGGYTLTDRGRELLTGNVSITIRAWG